MAPDNVHHGFFNPWVNHHLPFSQRFLITITDNEAIAFCAIIGLYLLYASDRCWSLIRHHLQPPGHPQSESVTRPSAVETRDQTIRETDVSQTDAILDWWRGQTMRRQPKTSSKLGIAALLNLLFWLFFGPIYTWCLTEFGQETPVVRSRATTGCGCGRNSENLDSGRTARKAERFYVSCHVGDDTAEPSCDNLWDAGGLPESQGHCLPCPLFGDYQESEAFVWVHDISPRSLGYNIDTPLTLRHYLTCAPLRTERFLSGTNLTASIGGLLQFIDINQGGLSIAPFALSYAKLLKTANGPHSTSTFYSGWHGGYTLEQDTGSVPQLKVDIIPTVRPNSSADEFRLFHPTLRRHDASTFILVLTAGHVAYRSEQPITDSLFRATRNISMGGQIYYLPDYEATSLGCWEQYRFCSSPLSSSEECSKPFGSHITDRYYSQEYHPLWHHLGDHALEELTRHPSRLQLLKVFALAHEFSSVNEYLRVNPKLPMVTSAMTRGGVMEISSDAQWRRELGALFDISFLQARYELLNYANGDEDACKDCPLAHEICNNLLFRNGDYTNINLLGLIVPVTVVNALILWSLWIQHQGRALAVYMKIRERTQRWVRELGSAAFNRIKCWVGNAMSWARHVLMVASPRPHTSREIAVPNLQLPPTQRDSAGLHLGERDLELRENPSSSCRSYNILSRSRLDADLMVETAPCHEE
jgi:hypothetical protein